MRGRPKSPNPLGVNVPVRLPPDIKSQLQAEADRERTPLSTYCRALLVKHCQEAPE